MHARYNPRPQASTRTIPWENRLPNFQRFPSPDKKTGTVGDLWEFQSCDPWKVLKHPQPLKNNKELKVFWRGFPQSDSKSDFLSPKLAQKRLCQVSNRERKKKKNPTQRFFFLPPFPPFKKILVFAFFPTFQRKTARTQRISGVEGP